MKRYFRVILVLSLISILFTNSFQAQDTTVVYDKDTIMFDSETKELTITTKKVEVGVNESGIKLTTYFLKRRTENPDISYSLYICLYSTLDLGCSGIEGNYIRIKLENGEYIKLMKDASPINCKMPVESMYLLEEEILEKLKAIKISSIMLKQSKYHADFSILYQDFFQKSMNLLAKYI